MSDPYNPFEAEYRLTRQALELIDTYGFGVSIATKSPLITRDIDLLTRIRKNSPVLCKITITTAEDSLSRQIEPGVGVSSERFHAIRELSRAGIFTGILMTPVLPYLTDTKENVLELIHRAHDSGAKFIYVLFGMTLRQGQREYYYGKLNQLYPGKSLVKQYMDRFGETYECHSPQAEELIAIFTEECERLGILYRMEDIIAAYKGSYGFEQLSLSI
jgi:DNA repair photolyase